MYLHRDTLCRVTCTADLVTYIEVHVLRCLALPCLCSEGTCHSCHGLRVPVADICRLEEDHNFMSGLNPDTVCSNLHKFSFISSLSNYPGEFFRVPWMGPGPVMCKWWPTVWCCQCGTPPINSTPATPEITNTYVFLVNIPVLIFAVIESTQILASLGCLALISRVMIPSDVRRARRSVLFQCSTLFWFIQVCEICSVVQRTDGRSLILSWEEEGLGWSGWWFGRSNNNRLVTPPIALKIIMRN